MAVEEGPELRDLARKILDEPPEVGKTFTIEEFASNSQAFKTRVLTVMRIFRGFGIVQKIDREYDRTEYSWKGLMDKTVRDTLWAILENRENETIESTNGVQWNICCKILRALMSARKVSHFLSNKLCDSWSF